MESRNMVLMNLFVRQQWRNREETYRHGKRGGEVRSIERVWKFTLPYVKGIANGNLLMSQGTQTGALYQPRGVGWGGKYEGGSRGRGYTYTYG